MGDSEVVKLGAGDVDAAGGVLHEAARGAFASVAEAVAEVAAWRAADPEGAWIARAGGRVLGVACARRIGEVAMIGPLAASPSGVRAGGALLDQICQVADAWGVSALRTRFDAGDERAFALAGSRAFAVIDVAARIVRAPGAAPKEGGARGLEIGAPRGSDLDQMIEMDRRMTGLERADELKKPGTLCARRRGALVGFLRVRGHRLGPGLALDVADLGVLMAKALAEGDGSSTALLSTAAPTAILAALGLGYRVEKLEIMAVRGLAPPARPVQIYEPALAAG